MKQEFIPYKQALELKELGFNEPCFGYYEPNGELDYIENHILKYLPYLAKNSEWQDLVAASTFSQAFRWFREKYNLICRVDVTSYGCPLDEQEFFCEITSKNGTASYEIFNTYEEAELDCLIKLIEIVKTK